MRIKNDIEIKPYEWLYLEHQKRNKEDLKKMLLRYGSPDARLLCALSASA